MRNKAVGFYFTLVAAVLALVGIILYPNVMYRLPVVYVLCAAALVLTIAVTICSIMNKKVRAFDYLPVVNAVLMASAAVWAIYLMVNQIGYVVAKLDEQSTIMGLIYFEVVALAGMLLNIIASFLKQEK